MSNKLDIIYNAYRFVGSIQRMRYGSILRWYHIAGVVGLFVVLVVICFCVLIEKEEEEVVEDVDFSDWEEDGLEVG